MSSDFAVNNEPQRPSTVTFAVYAQFAIGAIGLVSAIIGIFQTSQIMTNMSDEIAKTEVEGLSQSDLQTVLDFSEVVAYGSIGVGLLFPVAVAILGIFNLRGKNGTRIATWVLAGLGLLCGLCGATFSAIGAVGGGGASQPGADDAINEATIKATENVPGWYTAATTVVTVLDVVLYLAIIILLAVPASNVFFGKPASNLDITLPPQAYMDAPPAPAPGPATTGEVTPPTSGTDAPPAGPNDVTPPSRPDDGPDDGTGPFSGPKP